MTGGKRLRGAEAVVRALEDEGIPFAFGIPGTHNIELYDRLGESEVVHAILVKRYFTDYNFASALAKLGYLELNPSFAFHQQMLNTLQKKSK